MNVNNNSKNYNINNPKPINKEEVSMLDKDTRMKILIKKCKEILLESAEREVPENGKFSRVSIAFNIPETNNQGLLFIDCDPEDSKTKRTLSIGVRNKNSDRLISNFLATGTKTEILESLQSEEDLRGLISTVNHLSDKTDEYHSSL